MNRYIIEDIKIQNFKCIANFELNNQELNNLIVFDGPNGYGKTTIFEAIEITLTERPRKHRQTSLDARYTFNDSPIHKNGNHEIILELILNDGIKKTSVKRIFPPNKGKSRSNNIYNIFNDSKLFINNINATFQNLEETLGFNNLYNLFSILHYVEQDENTFFLKKDPKERYSSFLQSLLGGDKERQELQKIISLDKKISQEAEKIKDRIDEISKQNDNSNSFENNVY
ncbi:ATP-binding protein, partial [Chryseobacterium sp. HMWF035]|uniref:ATP-binding protein n=1 Tax=Chryseobacterium sp. HMWF035 TaxID=2056868 RepID=UPI000D57033C